MESKKESFLKKNKKEIIVVVLAVLAFSLLFYFLFFKEKLPNSSESPNQTGKPVFNFGNLFNFFTSNGDKGEGLVENPDDTNFVDHYFESLIKVWDKPVAGYGFYDKVFTYKYTDSEGVEQTSTSSKTILQFVDSETGFIYEKDLMSPTSTPVQVTTSSFPNTVQA